MHHFADDYNPFQPNIPEFSSTTTAVEHGVPAPKAKRARTQDEDERSSDRQGEDSSDGQDPLAVHQRACLRCKNLKVKCEVKSIDERVTEPCRRCKNGGYECVLPGKKKRRAPPKRQDLLKQIQEQASMIKQLQARLHTTASSTPGIAVSAPPYDYDEEDEQSSEGDDSGSPIQHYQRGGSSASSGRSETIESRRQRRSSKPTPLGLPADLTPLGSMARLSLDLSDTSSRLGKRRHADEPVSDEEDDATLLPNLLGPDNGSAPDSANDAVSSGEEVPSILARGVITPEEAETLFRIYFDYMNLSTSLLDPVLYSARKTYLRSQFLFTVVCTVAARFYQPQPELYNRLMDHVRLSAGTALISGRKNVELVYAYLLLALYPVPCRRWQDDRSWLYLGLAIRVAMDLNLHRPPPNHPLPEVEAREVLNGVRAWINCYNYDRAIGSQYGKESMISNLDYIANHADEWWKATPWNVPDFDIHLVACTAELRCLGNFKSQIYSDPNDPLGLNKMIDIQSLALLTADTLQQIQDASMLRLHQFTDLNNLHSSFRASILRLTYPYSRLVVLSFALQHVWGQGNPEEQHLLIRCMETASEVARVFVDDVGRPSQRVYLRHGPEIQSVFATFACAFLVKLLLPKFARHLHLEQRQEIVILVQRVIDLLGSPDVAVDERHGPKLYGRSLARLLAAPTVKAATRVSHRHRPMSGDFTPGRGTVVSPPLTSSPLSAGAHNSYFDLPHGLIAGSPGHTPEIAPLLVPGFSSILGGAYTPTDPLAMPTMQTGGLLAPPSWADWSAEVGLPPSLHSSTIGLDPEVLQSMQEITSPHLHPFPNVNWG